MSKIGNTPAGITQSFPSKQNITGNGGFDGFTSKIKYVPDRINPQQAYDIYKEGFGFYQDGWLPELKSLWSQRQEPPVMSQPTSRIERPD